MSKTLNMVRNTTTGQFGLSRGSVPAAGQNSMWRERMTKDAARRLGLLPNPFGGKKPAGTFGVPKGKVWGEHWSMGDPFKPDPRSWGRAGTRVLGLTPMGKGFKLGKALLRTVLQHPDLLDPPPYTFGPFAEPPGRLEFTWSMPPTEECGSLSADDRWVQYSGSLAFTELCGQGLQVPSESLEDFQTAAYIENSNQVYIGPGDPNFPDLRMVFGKGYFWPPKVDRPPEHQRITATITRTPGVPLPLYWPDPREPGLAWRMLNPFTPPLIGRPSGPPLPVPWSMVKGRGFNGPDLRSPSTDYRPVPGIEITAGGTGWSPPHAVRPPTYGEKEKKRYVPWGYMKAFRGAQKFFHGLTEAGDGIDAAFDATGCGNKKGIKTPQAKLEFIYEHFDCLDVGQFLGNLLYNHYEDKVVGGGMRKLQEAHKRLGLPGSYKSYQPTLR